MEYTKHAIIREAKVYCCKPLCKVGKSVNPNISATAVRNILHEAGLHHQKVHKVVYLTRKHKEKWLQWAKEYQKWKADDWSKVIWSDEVYVYIGDDQGTVWVTRALMKNFTRIVLFLRISSPLLGLCYGDAL